MPVTPALIRWVTVSGTDPEGRRRKDWRGRRVSRPGSPGGAWRPTMRSTPPPRDRMARRHHGSLTEADDGAVLLPHPGLGARAWEGRAQRMRGCRRLAPTTAGERKRQQQPHRAHDHYRCKDLHSVLAATRRTRARDASSGTHG